METKPAMVLDFTAATGEGVARLAEGGPLSDVRFALSACRGFVPAEGVSVHVGELGPDAGGPLSGGFALRAGLVERASEWPELPIVHTVGITSAERGTNLSGKPVALVPFDPRSFEGVKSAYPEELVAKLTFGPAAPAAERPVPAHLALIGAALRPVARIALACKATDGGDAVGSSFVAGDAADIGDAPWPTHRGKPMMPLVQIGLAEAKRIGIDRQVNVFVGSKPRASSNTEVHVATCAPGERRVGPKSLGERATLTTVEDVSVYPGIVGLQSAYRSVGVAVPLDLRRYHHVWAMTGGAERKLRSIQREIQDHFPECDDVEADVVLGGFSRMLTQGEPPLRRLVTLSIARFAWLRGLPKHQMNAFVDVSPDDPPCAFLR